MPLFLASSFDYLGNFLDQLPSFVASMLISIICGLVIGLERESRGKPAGARTLVLICLGSAMFAQVSGMIAGDYGDPGRVAAQIVTGIGFLGAGAILHQSEKGYIAGLTTAASIWVTAAIVVIVGSHHYLFAIVAVIFVLLSLRSFRLLEGFLFYSPHLEKRRILFDPQSGKTEWMLVGMLEDHMINPTEYKFAKSEDGRQKILELKYCKTNRNHRSFMSDIAVMPTVLSIGEAESLSSQKQL